MPAKKAAPSPPPSAAYALKITLKGIRPPIWRRLLVPDSVSLAGLHAIIQTVMGWKDQYLHTFVIAGREYGEPSTEGIRRILDERKFTLRELVPAAKTKIKYTYDFGDDWEHEIEVEEILPVPADQALPVCLKGKRACPPEHVGGAWGYGALLEARANPRHPERQTFAALIATYDPEAFDVTAVNAALRKLRL